MDPDGGNGEITPLVAGVLRDLYHLPPGTVVSRRRPKRLGLRRPGGRNVMTFVSPGPAVSGTGEAVGRARGSRRWPSAAAGLLPATGAIGRSRRLRGCS